jgi:hypothetical protein
MRKIKNLNTIELDDRQIKDPLQSKEQSADIV